MQPTIPLEQSLLFEVWVDGNEYKIFANGRVCGFGENAKIVNHFPRVMQAYFDLLQAGTTLPPLVEGTESQHTQR